MRAVYSDAPVPAVKVVYENILALAEEAFTRTPTERRHLIENTQRLQARAFVALVTYLLEQNGNNRVLL